MVRFLMRSRDAVGREERSSPENATNPLFLHVVCPRGTRGAQTDGPQNPQGQSGRSPLRVTLSRGPPECLVQSVYTKLFGSR